MKSQSLVSFVDRPSPEVRHRSLGYPLVVLRSHVLPLTGSSGWPRPVLGKYYHCVPTVTVEANASGSVGTPWCLGIAGYEVPGSLDLLLERLLGCVGW